jgi:hypothetical protein
MQAYLHEVELESMFLVLVQQLFSAFMISMLLENVRFERMREGDKYN